MTHEARTSRTARGFTLIELLVVIGIIAALAAILLPAIRAVTRATRTSTTEALIQRLAIALDHYFKEESYFPPDYMPSDAGFVNFRGTGYGALATALSPPETLYYYLAHPQLTLQHPMLKLSRTETMDTNQNSFPEVVDPWGRPLLYNRPVFPGCADGYYNYAATGVELDPAHNTGEYDLYSVGPDGQTGDDDLPSPGPTTLGEFCQKGMDNSNDGEGEDDVANWKK